MSRQSRRRLGHICGPTRARMLGHRPATASLSPEFYVEVIIMLDQIRGRDCPPRRLSLQRNAGVNAHSGEVL